MELRLVKPLIISLIALSNSMPAFAGENDLYAYKENGEGHWGLCDYWGTVIVYPIFDEVDRSFGPISEFAAVSRNGKWGFIDKKGEVKLPFKFEKAQNFQNGLAPVMVDGKWGLINESGTYIVRPQYDFMWWNEDNTWYISKEGIGQGRINKNGTILVAPQFEGTGTLSEGLLAVKQNGKWGYIDETGNFAVYPKFDYAFSFEDGLATVGLIDNRNILKKVNWGNINKSGKYVIQPQFRVVGFENREIFHEGLACVYLPDERGGKLHTGYIDKSGKLVTPLYEGGWDFYEGVAAVESDNKWGYIDKTGNWIVKPKYEMTYSFSDGLAAVKIDGKWGFIDKTGNLVIPPQFDDWRPFKDGMAEVITSGKHGCINKTGVYVISPEFLQIDDFKDGIASALKEFNDGNRIVKRWGFIDRSGNFFLSRREALKSAHRH